MNPAKEGKAARDFGVAVNPPAEAPKGKGGKRPMSFKQYRSMMMAKARRGMQ